MPVSAAVSPHFPVNYQKAGLVSWSGQSCFACRIARHRHLLGSGCYGRLPFVIIDDDIGFEVVFGLQWENWCEQKKVRIIPFPSFCRWWLFSVDVPSNVYYDLSSSDAYRNDVLSLCYCTMQSTFVRVRRTVIFLFCYRITTAIVASFQSCNLAGHVSLSARYWNSSLSFSLFRRTAL